MVTQSEILCFLKNNGGRKFTEADLRHFLGACNLSRQLMQLRKYGFIKSKLVYIPNKEGHIKGHWANKYWR